MFSLVKWSRSHRAAMKVKGENTCEVPTAERALNGRQWLFLSYYNRNQRRVWHSCLGTPKIIHVWKPLFSLKRFVDAQKLRLRISLAGVGQWTEHWAPAYEPNGHRFVSQSGHRPGLWARFPVRGAWEATTHWCFSHSLCPSLPLCLRYINNILKKI